MRLIVLDLDRTLFNTGQFYHDFLGMISESYNLQLATDMRAAEAKAEHFDPLGYLEEQGIKHSDITTSFHDYIRQNFPAGHHYLFPDALDLLDQLADRSDVQTAIMTTGSLHSQEFKFGLSPQLIDLPKEILPGSKGVRLQHDLERYNEINFNGHAYEHLSLVDDRTNVLLALQPRPDLKLVHIVRPGTKYQEPANRADIAEVQSLSDITAILI